MPSTIIDLSIASSAGFFLQADYGDAHFGISLASADINGDGYDDMIVGAPDGNFESEVYVVFGGPGPFGSIDMTGLGSRPFQGFAIRGVGNNIDTGSTVGSAGDINGDGFEEISIASGGKVYVIFGKAGGFSTIDLTALTPADGFVISNATICASAGDVNGDGYDDVNAGGAVIYGKSSGFGPIDIATLAPSDGFVTNVPLETAGDINNDGYDDLVSSLGTTIYALLGKAGGLGSVDGSGRQVFDVNTLTSADGFKVTGFTGRYGGTDGINSSSAGDVNGDGFDDFIIGAPNAGPFELEGESYLIFGKSSGAIGPTINVASLAPTDGFIIRGANVLDNAGWGVSSAGDVNMDGFADIVVGAVRTNRNGPISAIGGAYIIFGKESGFGTTTDGAGRSILDLNNLDSSRGLYVHGNAGISTQSNMGFEVSTGDVNGDGFADVMIGAPWDPHKGGGSGRTYVLYGFESTTAVVRNGSAAGQEIFGGTANDTIDGKAGDDILDGRGGDDSIVGGSGADLIRGGAGADSLEGGTEADIFSYRDAAESTALAMDRIRDFQTGVDKIDLRETGATNVSWVSQTDGSGTYNLVTVLTPGGTMTIRVDTAVALSDFLLPTGVINGTAGDDTISGTAGNDEVVGLAGNDSLYGGSGGTDRFRGGQGNDNIVVNSRDDVVIEYAGQGYDTVFATVSYTLTAGAEVEGLGAYAASGTERLDLTGNEFGNRIVGNAGSNNLDGGGGADILYGGAGDDYYVVDSLGDVVVEYAGEGYDRVYAKSSFTLSAGSEVEEVWTFSELGTASQDLTGNELANRLYGNSASNTLNGGSGADALFGGLGNDYYIVDNAADQVFESNGQGYDIVFTSVSYTLQASSEVESIGVLDPSTTQAIDLTGNGFANRMVGNAGTNSLDGGGGADTLYGEGGNDYYVVDNVGDKVIEGVGQGYDIVFSRASYILTAGQEVESLGFLTPSSTAPLDLTGNEFANLIVGSAGANTLNGGAGNDVIYGEGGADRFLFNTALGASNVDRLADFNATDDTIVLENAVFTGLANGGLPGNAFVTGTSAQDADDRIIYDSATGSLFFDADGNGAGAAILFATFNPGTALTAADFSVI